MSQMISNMYENGEWPKDFAEVAVISLKREPEATKCSDHCMISLIAYKAKIVVRILRTIEMKTGCVLGEDQFGFRRGKRARDALGMLRIISERTLDIDKELCACCVEWQAAFNHVNWTNLMQIMKETGINWHERKLSANRTCVQS
jgi:hypothetical protein